MNLRDILRVKGSEVYAIAPTASLADVVQKMVHHRCGALLVCADPKSGRGVVGIISERDILRACSERNGGPIGNIPVADYMTMDIVTGTLDNSVEYIMGVMTDHRIRHLPVLEGDDLVGMISIGDVVKAQHHQMVVENHYLKSYIQG